MKSYILGPITSRDSAVTTLDTILPGQTNPWLLKDTAGDAMAYFEVVPAEDTPDALTVAVDISGCHYNCDADVIAILKKLQREVGSEITYAP
jgi:hypothetical protein